MSATGSCGSSSVELSSTTTTTNNNNNTHNDNDYIIGHNGQPLHITWERNLAQDIIRRATEKVTAEIALHRNNTGTTVADTTTTIIPQPVPPKTPYMVAIAGIPGSGKSSSAEIITYLINQHMSLENKNTNDETTTTTSGGAAVCIPADGYHYDIQTLHQLEIERNDTTLIYRRGAPDTFNVSALLNDLQRIRYPTTTNTTTSTTSDSTTTGSTDTDTAPEDTNIILKFPGFDHSIGDPVINQHVYNRNQHTIFIMEGLYLLYNQYNWEHVKQYFNETIYIQTNTIDICMERVKQRNVVIPGYTITEIYDRVDNVDRNNAIMIHDIAPLRADYIITSKESPTIESVYVLPFPTNT